MNKRLLKKVIKEIGGDGHTIFDPQSFIDMGVPKEVVDTWTQEYESEKGSPKGTIFGHDGSPIKKLKGVYGLNVLRRLARELNVEYEGKIGRGFEAREITEKLLAHLRRKAS